MTTQDEKLSHRILSGRFKSDRILSKVTENPVTRIPILNPTAYD